ncbi:hypothetical protein Syun_012921 [Stephania yunnanensis]|uniref:Protein COFACTOR ASSEMBLY OF COMPLEX C SUBUNIT B CCB2, chloroplastic n=1 Tax=Stephania yunnanensis TaxID=152371 RepID=A0AAP0K0G3_9MAGN
MAHLSRNPLPIQLKPLHSPIHSSKLRTTNNAIIVSARRDPNHQQQQQQLNLSVLRFTLGIPGLDESYLPRWLGCAFGSLLALNHIAASDSFATPAQLRSEALGLSLAAFSAALPYLGKFLKGATIKDQVTILEGTRQIFVMSEHLTEAQREDLAWGTFVLLKNTNSTAVLISVQDSLCVRGYWSLPEDASKDQMLDWFNRQIRKAGLLDLKDALYFPVREDSGVWKMLPKGTQSLLVQPLSEGPQLSANETVQSRGFILLASSMSYAYNEKDRSWIRAIASKFRGTPVQRYYASLL